MNGLAHDMILEEMARLPEGCKQPFLCDAKKEGWCPYEEGKAEGTCPLVRDFNRREAKRRAH